MIFRTGGGDTAAHPGYLPDWEHDGKDKPHGCALSRIKGCPGPV